MLSKAEVAVDSKREDMLDLITTFNISTRYQDNPIVKEIINTGVKVI
ncbi:hypothetical protein JCM15765_25790 [Paradesulfitobacterium aromaticivorans]